MKFEITTRRALAIRSGIFPCGLRRRSCRRTRKISRKPRPTRPSTPARSEFSSRASASPPRPSTSSSKTAPASSSRSSRKQPGQIPASQKSDLELSPSGELLRYEWSQSSGGSLSVFPDNDFLKERISTSATAKAGRAGFPVAQRHSYSRQQFLHSSRSAGLEISECGLPAGGRRHEMPAGAGGLWRARPARPDFDERTHGIARGKRKSPFAAPSAICCA